MRRPRAPGRPGAGDGGAGDSGGDDDDSGGGDGDRVGHGLEEGEAAMLGLPHLWQLVTGYSCIGNHHSHL